MDVKEAALFISILKRDSIAIDVTICRILYLNQQTRTLPLSVFTNMATKKTTVFIFFLKLLLTKHVFSQSSEGAMTKFLNDIAEFMEETRQEIELLKYENQKLRGQNQGLINQIVEWEHKIDRVLIDEESKSHLSYEAPIGAIVAWTPKPDADTLNPTSLPSGWVFCDGSKIEGGIWDGRTTPNLNGERRFLRGGNENDVLKLEDEETNYRDIYFLPDFTHDNGASGHAFSCSDYGGEELFALEIESLDDNPDDFLCERKGGDENRPKNMNILWIMKVK